MSDPGSTSTEKTGSSKKKISPARNVIGIVVLAAVIVVGFFQYSAVFAYNRAMKALDTRTQDEEKGVLAVPEVESLVGKSADGPGSDFDDGTRAFTKTKYTWRGPLKSYTLTAYYTKGAAPSLHHFESDGATYVPEPPGPKIDVTAAGSAEPKARGKRGRGPTAPGAEPSKTTAAPPDKATATGPDAGPSKTTTTAEPAKPTEPATETLKAAPAPSAPPDAAKPPE